MLIDTIYIGTDENELESALYFNIMMLWNIHKCNRIDQVENGYRSWQTLPYRLCRKYGYINAGSHNIKKNIHKYQITNQYLLSYIQDIKSIEVLTHVQLLTI